MILIFYYRLQGTCLKGDSCEFSHVIDVQEVASKMAPTTPTISPIMKKYDLNDYPQLTSSRTTQPTIHSTTPANAEEEFPSLASTSKIKKPTTVKGGTVINFAAAAKKKGTAVKSNKSTHTEKATNKRQGYSMQKLKQPVHIPWLDTGSALNSIYMKEVYYKQGASLTCYSYDINPTERTGYRVWYAEK